MEELEEMEWTFTMKSKASPKVLDFFEKIMALWADSELHLNEELLRDIFKLGLKKVKTQLEESVNDG